VGSQNSSHPRRWRRQAPREASEDPCSGADRCLCSDVGGVHDNPRPVINTARSDFCGWAEGIPQHQPLPSLEPRSSRPGLFIAPLNVAIANYPGQRFPLRNGALVMEKRLKGADGELYLPDPGVSGSGVKLGWGNRAAGVTGGRGAARRT
jgi:hypothetical protein